MPRKEIEALRKEQERLELVLGSLIGSRIGGPAGGMMGRRLVEAHQASPAHDQEMYPIEALEWFLEKRRANPTPGVGSIPKGRSRKASAYSKKYGKMFKKLAPKYKKKNGSWKKDGFKRCGNAARRAIK